jgi:hypothetical protein
MRLALILALATLSTVARADDTPLFDGKSLAGWKAVVKPDKDGKLADPKDTWSVKDGVIVCTGKPNGYLATEKEYSDYTLKVKWRFPADAKAGNSGVLIHVQKEDKVWPVCVEAQLRSGRAGDIWLQTAAEVKLEIDQSRFDTADKTMRHYFRVPKDEAVENPFGEWNEYEIVCKGGDLTLSVNGRKVNEGKNGNLKAGRIALQAEGTEIHFKDITIKK